MRVVFTTQPFAASFNPLVPIARAAATAGHVEIRVRLRIRNA